MHMLVFMRFRSCVDTVYHLYSDADSAPDADADAKV